MLQLLINVTITSLILFSVINLVEYIKIEKQINKEVVEMKKIRSESIKVGFKDLNRIQNRLQKKMAA